MDKTTKIDALIANQVKFAEILVHFNGYKSADPAKHAILLEAYCEGLKPPLESFSQIDQAVIVMSSNY